MKNPYLKHLVKSLSIFYETFNSRPIHENVKVPELYYSEKLITKEQLQDYENSCKELKKYFEDIERTKIELKHFFQSGTSTTDARLRNERSEIQGQKPEPPKS